MSASAFKVSKLDTQCDTEDERDKDNVLHLSLYQKRTVTDSAMPDCSNTPWHRYTYSAQTDNHSTHPWLWHE